MPLGYIHVVFRGLKFEPDAEIGQKGAFCKGLGYSGGGNSSTERKEVMKDIDLEKVFK